MTAGLLNRMITARRDGDPRTFIFYIATETIRARREKAHVLYDDAPARYGCPATAADSQSSWPRLGTQHRVTTDGRRVGKSEARKAVGRTRVRSPRSHVTVREISPSPRGGVENNKIKKKQNKKKHVKLIITKQ